MKSSWIIFFFPVVFTSCQWMSAQLPNEQELLEEELNKIDWTKVDTYPSVASCDSIFDETARKTCFFDYITAALEENLRVDTLRGTFATLDTLKVLVTIQADAQVSLSLYQLNDSLKQQLKSVDSLLVEKSKKFHELSPATKRGVPVTSQFVLPLVLHKQ
ncbi:hypothetical protein M2306_002633 [Myroides gitamensis]|jgi:hypothetical protein|uniref:Uncharacterized protein n=1 Tax=Myroides odoratus TaxID=256 RepID=A0A378U594_MYROD|nr:hypothetical protein [Myroides odoratus]MDH6601939.1 hypothetical protein [Myroides gitamensis]MCS4237331.1 hypothetical protein [Myroides odoratus]MDR0223840.1 hypothetical protein [Myroides odoratus]QQU03117.1 hypothetical protein I6I89_15065 [Myroides odoratus]STZ69640.1 Uncharacterised protein [Myroides odoratus]